MRKILFGLVGLLFLMGASPAWAICDGYDQSVQVIRDPISCAIVQVIGGTPLGGGSLSVTNAGGGSAPGNPAFTVPGTAAYTDTVKTLTVATDTTLLAASASNKSVCVMNIGTNPATITNGSSAAVVGNGQALNGASVAGAQGGGYCWPLPPTNAIHAISTLGTTIIVTVGQ